MMIKSRVFGNIWNARRSARRQFVPKHWWHLDCRKARRLDVIYSQINKERIDG